MEEIVKIPVERVSALIGENGQTKRMLEEACKIKLDVHSDGEVHSVGETAEVYFSKDIIIAIGRGFEPRTAIKLLDPNYRFYLFHLKEYFESDNAITRIKGRVIGENGKVKKEIESAADSWLSIYGSTIGIIGKEDSIEYAKEAVEMLIHGANHSSVFKYLADAKRKIFEERLRGS